MLALVSNNAVFVLIAATLSYRSATISYVVSGQVTPRDCLWNQHTIFHAKGVACRDCPTCPEGLGLNPQCGSRVRANEDVECTPCEEGIGYSDTYDISSCKPCTICDPNEETIHRCTPTTNAVCGKCNAGFYRAVTGDCQPCSWCCTDSRNDERERECMEQSGLPANQVCRYDINTIKCAPNTSYTTATAHSTKGSNTDSSRVAANVMRNGTIGSKIWLVALIGFFGLVACGVVGLLCLYQKKNNVELSLTWWKGCVNKQPSPAQSTDWTLPSQLVSGRKSSEVKSLDPRISSPHGESDTRV